MLKVSSQLTAEKSELLYPDDHRAACKASTSFSHTVEKAMHHKNKNGVQPVKRSNVLDTVKSFNKLQAKATYEMGGSKRSSRRQQKLELEQDIEKLKKKLRYEENVHRALERAFTRPLGALPRLPPYLSPKTLELLAEVAVLEEEVVRLEEQIVHLRQGLYQEALCITSSKRQLEAVEDEEYSEAKKPELMSSSFCYHNATPESRYGRKDIVGGGLLPAAKEQSPDFPSQSSSINRRRAISVSGCEINNGCPVAEATNLKNASLKQLSEDVLRQPNKGAQKVSGPFESHHEKENQLHTNARNSRSFSREPKPKYASKKPPHIETKGTKVHPSVSGKTQMENRIEECDLKSGCISSPMSLEDVKQMDANKLSEETIKCLLHIYLRLSKQTSEAPEIGMRTPSPNSILNCKGQIVYPAEDLRGPYGACFNPELRDVGPYKHMHEVVVGSIDMALIQQSSFLVSRLKILFERLSVVDLRGMTHRQKLAFWINTYNTCMMNAFLEHGIPTNPQMMISFMRKAVINIGGHLLNALTIEHFILRLPYNFKDAYPKNGKRDIDTTIRSVYGLEWSEPLITFALSCGSRSSPAVRIYTAANIDMELEVAKKEYLQAAVGFTAKRKMLLPKLLDWYSWDFAKDLETLLRWICLQLPTSLQNAAVECLERGKKGCLSDVIEVMPYEFDFRYLFARVY